MQKVFIVSAKRTPIGKFGGSLSSLNASELGAAVLKSVINQSNVNPENIDQILMGNVLQASQGQNPARQAAVKAGIPYSVPAITINDVCGSGLYSINAAASLIQSNQANIVLAGGMESMSNAPYYLNKARFGYRLGDGILKDSILTDALTDAFGHFHMGETAENISKKYNVSRDEMDNFSLNSHLKAVNSTKNGSFKDEITPVKIKTKTKTDIITVDEGPRENSSLNKLGKLKPAFQENGNITAGNSSGINDGAAVVLLAGEDAVKENNLTPICEWRSSDISGVDPKFMGIGPYESVQNLINKTKNIFLDDVTTFELNEAFAAQAIACNKLLKLNPDKVNPLGGSIALGHPVGASGARILTTLIHELKNKNDLGIASLCVGGGMGVSTLIKKV